jgi:hypothetical protein
MFSRQDQPPQRTLGWSHCPITSLIRSLSVCVVLHGGPANGLKPNPTQPKTNHLVFSLKPKPKTDVRTPTKPISRPAVPVPPDGSKTGEKSARERAARVRVRHGWAVGWKWRTWAGTHPSEWASSNGSVYWDVGFFHCLRTVSVKHSESIQWTENGSTVQWIPKRKKRGGTWRSWHLTRWARGPGSTVNTTVLVG